MNMDFNNHRSRKTKSLGSYLCPFVVLTLRSCILLWKYKVTEVQIRMMALGMYHSFRHTSNYLLFHFLQTHENLAP